MRMTLISAAALAAALSACTVNNNAPAEDNNAAMVDETASTSASTDEAATSGQLEVKEGNLSTKDPDQIGGMPVPPPASAASIPAQYQGRWGMVPADCTSTRGDAKGLITIDSKTIKFYESRATLKEQRPAIATSFSGLFAFTGEGQEWTRVETLTRTGDTLKRADEEGSFTYTRCR